MGSGVSLLNSNYDEAGNLKVNVVIGGGGGGSSSLSTAAKGTTPAGNPTSTATDVNTQALHAQVVNFPATQPVSIAASVAVTGPLTNTEIRATALPVSGTFFQAVQPVSATSLPLPTGAGTEATLLGVRTDLGTDGTTPPAVLGAGTGVRGWLRSIYEKLTGSIAVTGTFFQAIQAVNTTQMGGVGISVGSGISGTGVQRMVLATDVVLPAQSEQRAATLHVSISGLINTVVTASLPAPAAGLFHYITGIQLVKVYNALGVAAGAGVLVTSTNLPGSPVWTTEQAAGAVGTAPTVINYTPTTPLKSALAATATTFVAPAQLQTIWRWNVSYFTAP